MKTSGDLASLLQSFFTDRLVRQREASPHTIASYRDTFCLLLAFLHRRLGKEPSNLAFGDLDAPSVGAFLQHLEQERGNSARTRNVRLAAVHSFFRYAAFLQPAHGAQIQRVLAMPSKRYDHHPINFLAPEEIDALLATPDRSTRTGRRDHTLLLLALETGLRVSELVGLRVEDLVFGTGAHVRCMGKGRKARCTPLRRETAAAMRAWLRELGGEPRTPVFPSSRGGSLSRDGVGYLVAKHAQAAAEKCPSLRSKRVSPHVLRHSAAMELLQHGVGEDVIALWLGHESSETTKVYLHADLSLKERALAKTRPPGVRAGRYRPPDRLLSFLKNL